MISKKEHFSDKFKKSHPLGYKILHIIFCNKIVILFFWGLIIWGTILPHIVAPIVLTPIGYFFHSTDTTKPKIEGTFPNINERLVEPPKEIKISFREEGGSGIDREKTNIILRGARVGNIYNKSIEYENSMIKFIPNQSLEPDAYTVGIELVDRGGNINLNSFSFYVLENPRLNVSIYEVIGQIKNWWFDYSNVSNEQYNSYLLWISNQNTAFLENFQLDVQFPGVIIDYAVHEDIGNYVYNIRIGRGNIFLGIPTINTTSCCSIINIKEIAPGGDLLVVFYIDLEIEKYDNAMWCRPGIFDSGWHLVSDYENEYSVSYYYQEYGHWYYNNTTDKFKLLSLNDFS